MSNLIGKMILGTLAFSALFLAGSNIAWPKDISIALIDSGAKGYADTVNSFTSLSVREDPLDHGTQIANLVRNGFPQAKIHMLQVCELKDGQFQPSREAVLKAIQWSVEHHVDIVNMSLVMRYDQAIETAIEKAAIEHGIIFVAASGNRSLASHFASDQNGFVRKVAKDIKPAFPSSSPYVISVGAFDNKGLKADYSAGHCDVYENGIILGQEGTSFAAARVTSRIARAISENKARSKEEILFLVSPHP